MTSLSKSDLDKALDDLSPRIKRAFDESHRELSKVGVAHVVVGGLAVNAYGHHYSTKDIDYLVEREEAFEGLITLSFKSGVPFMVDGVAIDYWTETPTMPAGVRTEIRRCLDQARRHGMVSVASDWLLVWMKLDAGRPKDIGAIDGLIQAGLDTEAIREALLKVGPPAVIERFERCLRRADG